MKEIIHIQIGNAGNIVGTKCWEAICEEHGINSCGERVGRCPRQLEKIHVMFRVAKKKYVPRAIVVDLDPHSVDDVKGSRFGRIFPGNNMIRGRAGTGNNWAKAYLSEGRDLSFQVLDVARKETEKCDCMEGFQLVHSIGGGTGSGLGCLVLESLTDEYPHRYLSNHVILPSANIYDDRTQTYNAVLALRHMTEMNLETHCLDNRAVAAACEKRLAIPKPGYPDINYLMSTSVAAASTMLRLPGRRNQGLIRDSINLIPFPRLHYLTPGFLPLHNHGSMVTRTYQVADLAREAVDPANLFLDPNEGGKYMTGSYYYRGRILETEAKTFTERVVEANSKKFVDWLPESVTTFASPVPLRGLERAVVMVANTTAIAGSFARIFQLFHSVHKRRFYTRWLTDEGVYEEELDVAGASLSDLVREYVKVDKSAKEDVWNNMWIE